MRKTGRSNRTRQEETMQISLENPLRSQLDEFVGRCRASSATGSVQQERIVRPMRQSSWIDLREAGHWPYLSLLKGRSVFSSPSVRRGLRARRV